jgi:hypothetical protein
MAQVHDDAQDGKNGRSVDAGKRAEFDLSFLGRSS